MKFNRLIAIDPSLTASGWALFSLDSARPVAMGIIEPPGPGEFLASRLETLQETVEHLFQKLRLNTSDLLICEGPAPLVLNPESALKVERVRGIFETVARSYKVTVPGRLNPRTIQSELLGMRGKQLERTQVKLTARAVVEQLFGYELSELLDKDAHSVKQDIVDALLVGALAVTKVRLSIQSGEELAAVFSQQLRSPRGKVSRGYDSSWRKLSGTR